MSKYRLTEPELTVIDRVSKIADDTIAKHAHEVDEKGRFPTEAIKALGDAGFMGLTVPTEYGGQGQNLRVAAAAIDEISQRCSSTGMVYLMHLCGIAAYLTNPKVADGALREAAKGKHLSTLAWSERGSRSHFWAPMSQEVNAGDSVSLSGIKSWVTSAREADGYVATTRAAGTDHPMAITLYLILKSDRGFDVEKPWDAIGMRGNGSAPMVMNEVQVPKSRALTESGKGMDSMMAFIMPVFSIGNAAVSIGTAEAAIQSTQAHLVHSKMQHLGTSLADLPNLRERLARMRIRNDQARAHLSATLDAIEGGDPGAVLYVLSAKAQAAEAAIDVTDLAMRACGGAAFSKHLSVERNFRDARAMSVMAPTSDVLHDFIGKALCGMELF